MIVKLAGGRIIDPANGRDGIGDLYIQDGRIVAPPALGAAIAETVDLSGRIVMAGAIDIHSHIAGGNVGLARMLLPEPDRTPGLGWSAAETGRLYAEMGFTTVIEPAVAPHNAVHAHLELADIPYIDRGGLAVLGNDDFTLGLIRDGGAGTALSDYVAWTVETSKCLGVKVINAGGAAAFKDNLRSFAFDDVVPCYGVSSRAIVKALQQAVQTLGIPHPLHVHCNNLGLPGNAASAIATMEAAEGLPLHLAHLQFYGYGSEGKRGFSSAAAALAEAVNAHRSITIDVGQVMFGQTVTISSDVLRQFNGRAHARPKKWVIWDGDANGGGIVPHHYRAQDHVSALQWAIGLELFLLIDDPWRVFFTTDHPNGAHFTTYPQILHLLMDAGERRRWLEDLPRTALATSLLPELKREYSLEEVAIMTRAAPARLLGLADRGHLAPGAIADIAVYTEQADKTAMFRGADYVFKDGALIVRDGQALGPCQGRTQVLKPSYDRHIAQALERYYQSRYGLPLDAFTVPERFADGDELFKEHPCRS